MLQYIPATTYIRYEVSRQFVRNGKRNDEVLFDRQSDIKAEPFESLTEEELIHLVKGFKDLDQKDKLDLIDYMKKLEKTNPAMVKRVKSGMFDT